MRLYLDTSVIGGYFDPEFEEWTVPLVESIYKLEIYRGNLGPDYQGSPGCQERSYRSLE